MLTFVDFADAALFWTCLLPALKLTDRAMQANLASLPQYDTSGNAVTPTMSPGARLVRMDSAFLTEFAGPLILQGALTTCYCVGFYFAAQLITLAIVYVRSSVRAAMNGAKFAGAAADILAAMTTANREQLELVMEGVAAGKPERALSDVIQKAGKPSDVRRVAAAVSGAAEAVKEAADDATRAVGSKPGTHPFMHAVFENTMAAAMPLVQLSVAQAVIVAAGMGLSVVLEDGPVDVDGKLYFEVATASRLCSMTTIAAVPAMIVLQVWQSSIFSRHKAAAPVG